MSAQDKKKPVYWKGKRLTREEQKIYDAVLSAFPATSHLSAIDVAMKGGIKFQFNYR